MIVPIRKSFLLDGDGRPYAVVYFVAGLPPIAALPGDTVTLQLVVDQLDGFNTELGETFIPPVAERRRAEAMLARLDQRNAEARQLCQHWINQEAEGEARGSVTSYALGAAQCARDVLAALAGELTDEERESLGITAV